MNAINRRHFLKTLGASASTALVGGRLLADSPVEQTLFTEFGVNAKFSQALVAKKAGADYLLHKVRELLVPDQPEAEFEKRLAQLENSPLPVYSCNSFLTGGPLRSVGPEAMPDNVLRFAETTFKRAKRAGVKFIVFGSSKSRKLPEGWTKAQADDQFIPLLKRMGPMAEAEGVKLLIENLRSQECNYLSRVREVGEMIEQVDHDHVRILADIYHSSFMQDPPEDYAKYAHLTEMVEIAEKVGRRAPGVNGQDFTPYFSALKGAGYHGPIEMEGRWTSDQLPKAFATIREQAARASHGGTILFQGWCQWADLNF